MSQQAKSLVGQRYGRLLVLERVEKPEEIKSSGPYWLCLCDCGNKKVVISRSLSNDNTKSCGCLATIPHNKTHGLSGTPEYEAWNAMLNRCYNIDNPRYEDYGGRGIEVCESWVGSFENFLRDMGPRPIGHSIDRENNDEGYNPVNCRWATRTEQQNNLRSNRLLTCYGKTQTIALWSKELGISRATIYQRLNKDWPIAHVLSSGAIRW